ncbi:Thromboxane-A synthase (TS) (TXA synthase) (TXS) (Cytochrome P450 5A1) (Hydroperoxy icosatetraenoate dehydratase) [Durusdinium trenchii]|uniref:Thromboxane-A synthase (TS) (TXA synthase) (TXS) (Cytochrome P450 5A1) (Hydroperoxy icosatetraenoate dehydratase) n=1 Tax=Durusdinium trenchii TaxID=1381693 RepID=A0ABP0LZV0_9DINO
MASCLCYLCAHPDCKAKLLKEIDEVVGDDQIRWEHLSQMPYLDWCIKETMRLVPPAVGFMRQARGPQLLGKKWRIDAGMPVIVNAAWSSERKWDPKRGHGQLGWEFLTVLTRFAYIPFAVGPRACIGREFTVVEQKVTMVTLFQHFDFQRPKEVQVPEGYKTVRQAEAKSLGVGCGGVKPEYLHILRFVYVYFMLGAAEISPGKAEPEICPRSVPLAQLAVPEDLECQKGPHAAVWSNVKKSFRALLEDTPGALFNPIPEAQVKTAVDQAIAQVKAAGGFDSSSTNECGYGKLALQLLSVCLVSDPFAVAQTVQSAGEAFASPVLTLLLDIPWVATALSGWPLFGLLAQVSLRKARTSRT